MRRDVFTFFEKSVNNNVMERVLELLKETYNPERESMWLRSAVPLLLSLSKRSSDYDRFLFDQPLEEGAQYFDIEYRNSKYFN